MVRRKSDQNKTREELVSELQIFKDKNKKLLSQNKELKQLENSRRKNESIFHLIVENSLDLVSVTTFDMKATFIYISPSYKKTLGFSPEELVGTSSWNFIHPDDKKKLMPLLKKYVLGKAKQLISGGKEDFFEKIEYRLPRKSGGWSWMEGIASIRGKNMVFISRDISEHLKILENLKNSEKFLESVINQSPYPTWVSDLNGVMIKANPALTRVLNLNEEQLIGKYNVFEDPQAKKQGLLEIIRDTLTKGKVSGFVLEWSGKETNDSGLKDSNKVYAEGTIFPVFDQNSKITNAVITYKDVSARKKAEAELELERSRLTNVLEGTKVGTWEWNVPTGEVVLNERSANIIGFSLKEIFPVSINTWVDFVHPDDLAISNKLIQNHFEGKSDLYQCEVRQQHKKGNWIWVLVQGKIISWTEEGKPLMVIGTHQNITKIKKNQENLQERIKELQCFYNISDILEEDKNIEDILQEIVNIIPASWKYPEITWARITIGQQEFKTRNYKRTKWVQSRKFIFNKKSGELSVGYLEQKDEIDEGPFLKEEGKLLDAVAERIGRIIERKTGQEEKKSLEEQLRHSQKMETVGTLAGGIAHDFNNILTPILGYAGMISDSIPQTNPFYEDANIILEAGLRAKKLVEQILTFSRQMESELQSVELSTIVKEVAGLLRSTIPSTIEIKLSIEPTDKVVLADPTQIHQIVMNLCTNASHAMEKNGGVMTVELKSIVPDNKIVKLNQNLEKKEYLRLKISDTGTGIRTDIMERIFEPFFTTKRIGKGTGMGLSVVHGIVQSYGGEITVDSQPQKGSTFSVFLPAIPKIKSDTKSKAKVLQRGSGSILVVDDEIVICKMLKKMLKGMGYSITTCYSSDEALEIFQKQSKKFDLVLSDLTIPSISGLVLAEKLQKIKSKIPIIIMSGDGDKLSLNSGSNPAISGTIRKPLNFEELAAKIRDVLKKKFKE